MQTYEIRLVFPNLFANLFKELKATAVGFEPTVDLRHQINSLDRSTCYGNTVVYIFTRLIGNFPINCKNFDK